MITAQQCVSATSYLSQITFGKFQKKMKNIQIDNNKTIMKRILTIGDLRKVIENLDDDFTIEMRVRTRVPDEELAKRSYPYPFDTDYFEGIEFDDIGYSDKVICFGIETN